MRIIQGDPFPEIAKPDVHLRGQHRGIPFPGGAEETLSQQTRRETASAEPVRIYGHPSSGSNQTRRRQSRQRLRRDVARLRAAPVVAVPEAPLGGHDEFLHPVEMQLVHRNDEGRMYRAALSAEEKLRYLLRDRESSVRYTPIGSGFGV